MEKLTQLAQVMIAAPCNIGWENMTGDDKVRFCGECRLNVYNTSKMSESEIFDLMASDDICLRIYRRADGTMMTDNCPVGLRKIRDRVRMISKVAATFWAFAVSSLAAFAQNTSASPIAPVVESKPGVATNVGADSTAQDLFEKAKASIGAKQYKQAADYFSQAQDALRKTKHDPAFEQLVATEYLKFLQAHDGLVDATKMREATRCFDRSIVQVEPTVIDGRPGYHRRASAPPQKDAVPKL